MVKAQTYRRRKAEDQKAFHIGAHRESTNRLFCLFNSCQLVNDEAGAKELTVALSAQNLWCQILRGTTEGVGRIRVLHVELAQAEVAQGDMTGIVQKDVLRL